MAEIVDIAAHRAPPRPGNGAREAVISIAEQIQAETGRQFNCPDCADFFLALLWYRGFKVVPLDD
jgi:predicted ABC-class ATPase